MRKNTYSYKYAVEISRFVGVGVCGEGFAENLCQSAHAGDADYVDVNVAAEGLDQREVNLERDVILFLLVGSQDA